MNIGILGGGQLARMLMLAGIPMGHEFIVYTPRLTPTIHGLGTAITGHLDDHDRLRKFAQSVDCITFENENIPVDHLKPLETITPIYPQWPILAYAQDRLKEKQLFEQLGIPTNRYYPVDNADMLETAAQQLGFPLILKTRREGYDGKGQYRIHDKQTLAQVAKHVGLKDMLAENVIPFEREVSIIGARNKNGDYVVYDLCENTHHHGILYQTINRPQDPLQTIAADYLKKLFLQFDLVGVITIEFFVHAGQLIANEIAPRVHNSGHWTIEGATTSQFENHIRAICNYPLTPPASIGQSMMFNCVSTLPNCESVLDIPYTHYHDYKKAPRPNRKLGHVTLVDPSAKPTQETITQLSTLIPPVR